jgi:uncharacterized protein
MDTAPSAVHYGTECRIIRHRMPEPSRAQRLFPVGGRLAEAEQIGRTPAIDNLERICTGGNSALLFDERRVGKSSVAGAVVDRIRSHGGIGIDIDLNLVDDLDGLAERIRIEVERLPALQRAARRGRAIATGPGAASLRATLQALGAKDESEALRLLGEQLQALKRTPSLSSALQLVERRAQLQRVTAIMFLDEVHVLADFTSTRQAQRELAEAMQHHGQLVLIFAGSNQRAVSRLFAEGKPMFRDGLTFPLPDIPDEAWEAGLTERFAMAGLSIHPNVIRQILAITDGHPQRTMSICAHALASASGQTIDEAVVKLAHARARTQPSWNR